MKKVLEQHVEEKKDEIKSIFFNESGLKPLSHYRGTKEMCFYRIMRLRSENLI